MGLKAALVIGMSRVELGRRDTRRGGSPPQLDPLVRHSARVGIASRDRAQHLPPVKQHNSKSAAKKRHRQTDQVSGQSTSLPCAAIKLGKFVVEGRAECNGQEFRKKL